MLILFLEDNLTAENWLTKAASPRAEFSTVQNGDKNGRAYEDNDFNQLSTNLQEAFKPNELGTRDYRYLCSAKQNYRKYCRDAFDIAVIKGSVAFLLN